MVVPPIDTPAHIYEQVPPANRLILWENHCNHLTRLTLGIKLRPFDHLGVAAQNNTQIALPLSSQLTDDNQCKEANDL